MRGRRLPRTAASIFGPGGRMRYTPRPTYTCSAPGCGWHGTADETIRTEEGLYCPWCIEQGRYAPKPESILHAFELVSMSGTVLKITGIGLTRESAETHLRQFSLKGTDWSNWQLREPAGAGHAEQETN